MMSTQRPSSPAAANFKVHSTPHPRSKNRSENIRHALAPPVLPQSPLHFHELSGWTGASRSSTGPIGTMLLGLSQGWLPEVVGLLDVG